MNQAVKNMGYGREGGLLGWLVIKGDAAGEQWVGPQELEMGPSSPEGLIWKAAKLGGC